MNHRELNEAISRHLPLWWTEEAMNKMKSAYGEEAFGIIDEICRFADQQTERLVKNGSTHAYQLTMDQLRSRYDFLTEESIVRIANMAAYSWK